MLTKQSEGARAPDADMFGLAARILCCPDCRAGLDDGLTCRLCRRSFKPDRDGVIGALPAAMVANTDDADRLQSLIAAAGPGEHGERVVLYEKAFHDAQASQYDKLFADPLPIREYYGQLVRREIYSYVRSQPFVVDLCCGTGKSSIPLVERGMPAVAMDVSREMLRVYKRKCDAMGHDKVLLVHADASRPPLLGESCGAIMMIGGLHHIRDSAGAVRSCCGALMDGGLLILHEPLKTGKTSRLARWLTNLYAATDPGRVWRAAQRRLGMAPAEAAGSQNVATSDFTPYERPFQSAGELAALAPGGVEALLLHSRGALSFREFSPPLQGRAGALLAPLIIRLDGWLSRRGSADATGDVVFAVFRKARG